MPLTRATLHALMIAAAVLGAAVALSTSARAGESCNLARQLMEIETLSTRVTATGNTPAAQKVIDRMLAAIRAIPPGSGRLISDELSTYELSAFLESRSQMARIFANHGLAAAQSHVNKSSYRTLSLGVRNLASLLACGEDLRDASDPGTMVAGAGAVENAADPSRTASTPRGGSRRVSEVDASLPLLGGMGVVVALSIFYFRNRMRHRDFSRHSCDLATELRLGPDTYPARIVDISVSGAKLKCNHVLEPRSSGTLSLGGHGWFSFRVIWSNEHFAGIAFKQHLQVDLHDVAAASTRNRW